MDYRRAVNGASCFTFLFAIIVIAAPWYSFPGANNTTVTTQSFGLFAEVTSLFGEAGDFSAAVGFMRFLVVMLFLCALAVVGLGAYSMLKGETKIGSMNIYNTITILHWTMFSCALFTMIIYGAKFGDLCKPAEAAGVEGCSNIAGGNGILIFMIFLEPIFAILGYKAELDTSPMQPMMVTRKSDVEMQNAQE